MSRETSISALLSAIAALGDTPSAAAVQAVRAAAEEVSGKRAEPTVADATVMQLSDQLRERGYVVSLWSAEDLDFLDDATELEHLEAAELAASKPALFDTLSNGLEDLLAERGNAHLGDAWGMNPAGHLQVLGVRQA